MVSVIYHDNDASKWISIESQLDTGASCSAMSIADPRRTVHVFIIVDYGMCLLLHLFSCHFLNVVYNNIIIIIHAVYNILESTNKYCSEVGGSLG